jgi:hypothetical protein
LAPTIADVLATARREIAMLVSVRIEAVKLDLRIEYGRGFVRPSVHGTTVPPEQMYVVLPLRAPTYRKSYFSRTELKRCRGAPSAEMGFKAQIDHPVL